MHHDELPLREQDFAAVRAAVMERIHHRPSRAPWLALAFGALAVVIVFVQRPVPLPVAPPRLPPVALAAPLPPIPELASSGGQARPPVLVKTPAKKRQARAPVVHRVRMHIQTADPDIRIIWIASQEGP